MNVFCYTALQVGVKGNERTLKGESKRALKQ